MSACQLSRRAALAAIGALATSQGAAVRSALARPGSFSSVRVDVAPLLENSGEPTAGWVAQTLPAAMAEALAAAGQSRRGVSLRINYVILGSNQGGECGAAQDQMVGAVTTGGAEWPLRASTSYWPSPVNNTTIERSNYNRVYQLSRAFAYWAARGI